MSQHIIDIICVKIFLAHFVAQTKEIEGGEIVMGIINLDDKEKLHSFE